MPLILLLPFIISNRYMGVHNCTVQDTHQDSSDRLIQRNTALRIACWSTSEGILQLLCQGRRRMHFLQTTLKALKELPVSHISIALHET